MANNHFRQGQQTDSAAGGGDDSDDIGADDLILAGVIAGVLVMSAVLWVMLSDDSEPEDHDPHPAVQEMQQENERMEFDGANDSFRSPEQDLAAHQQQAPEFDPDRTSREDYTEEEQRRDEERYRQMAEETVAEGEPDSVEDVLPHDMEGVDVEAMEEDARDIQRGSADPADYVDEQEMLPSEARDEVDVDQVRRQHNMD